MRIVVLAGGTSTERDVSLCSGGKIYKALKENGHKVLLLDVFLGLETDSIDTVFDRGDELLGVTQGISQSNPDINAIRALRKDDGRDFFGPNVLAICAKADVVFMALHGENGENGKVQAAFDLAGICYTGTDYLSSALAMNKAIAKELFEFHGVSTPQGISLKKGQTDHHTVALPAVVKVVDGGSSVGVYIVHTLEEYEQAKESAFQYGTEVIVEQYIKGREFSVGVIDGKVLPIIEIAPKSGFYDYKNKYQEGSTVETCPANLSMELTERMQNMATRAYEALRLSQYARMDFMMNENNEMYCLEANTLPGMTPTSLIPQEAAAIGVSYTQLCEQLINLALKKGK